MRQVFKSALEWLLVESGACGIVRQWHSSHAAILAYHNVIPSGAPTAGERSLHLPELDFERHLNILSRTHRFVGLRELLAGTAPSDGPLAAVTFDDAYRGAVTVGVGRALEYDIPVTIFVSPGLLGEHSFWWDRIATKDHAAPVSDETLGTRDSAKERERSFPAGSDSELGSYWPNLPCYAQPASVDELRDAAREQGVSLASHTWSHADLPKCDDEQLSYQLRRPHQWLSQAFPDEYINCLSYPYGFSDQRVRVMAGEVYRWALGIDGGLWRREDHHSSLDIPRINVDRNLSVRGLMLRSAGIM